MSAKREKAKRREMAREYEYSLRNWMSRKPRWWQFARYMVWKASKPERPRFDS